MAAKKRNTKRRSTNKKKKRSNRGKSSFRVVLQKVMKLRPAQRIEAMKIANNKFITDFSRQVKKLQRTRVSRKLQKRLSRHSKKLRKFTNSKTPVKAKRRMLTQQRGGFLPLLLAALPALGSIVGGVLSRT